MKHRLHFLFFLFVFARAAFAQLAVFDPANHLVNLAIQSNQQTSHVDVLRQWAAELEKLNQQIRQMEDLLATQRRLRDVAGDPVGSGVHVAGALGATDFARTYGETMQAVRRLSDAAISLRRTAEGVYRQLDDRTALGAGFSRRTADYRPYAAVERQADNLETVYGDTATRSAAVQAELAVKLAALRDAPTQAEVDKLNVTVAALNGQLALLAAQRRDEADKLQALQILNENQAAKERRDSLEKQIAEERQTLAAVNSWQQSVRLTPTTYARP